MQVGAIQETVHRYVALMERLVQEEVASLETAPAGWSVDLKEFIIPIMVS